MRTKIDNTVPLYNGDEEDLSLGLGYVLEANSSKCKETQWNQEVMRSRMEGEKAWSGVRSPQGRKDQGW